MAAKTEVHWCGAEQAAWERAVAGVCSHGGHGWDGEECSDIADAHAKCKFCGETERKHCHECSACPGEHAYYCSKEK